MSWDIYKAKLWFVKTGMDHIKDGLYIEGGELIFESKWDAGANSIDDFKEAIKRICWWDEDMIEDTIHEINNSACDDYMVK